MATHNDHGAEGESAVVDYLSACGFKILDRNWKNPRAEIDIIARKDGVVHFVEVKYRASDSQGSGFDYITPSKLRQMGYAAEVWVQANGWDGEHVLSAAQVSGSDLAVDFIEDCS